MSLKLIPELHRATQRVDTYLGAAPSLELTQAEVHLMAHLAVGAHGIGALQRQFGLRRSTLTSILDRLVGRGLVTREVPEEDRRSVIVRTTPEGRAVARRSRDYLGSLETRVARRVSAQALAGYHAVLRAIELEASTE